jgi:serine/threonine-protein kinase RsbW
MDASADSEPPGVPLAEPSTALVHEVAAAAVQVSILRRALARWVADLGVPDETAEDVVLAAGEAMANVVDHAYPDDPHGTMTLTAELEPGFLTVTVTDTGRWSDEPPQPHRGRGSQIMRAVAPEAAITSTPAGTTVRMTWPWTRAEAD